MRTYLLLCSFVLFASQSIAQDLPIGMTSTGVVGFYETDSVFMGDFPNDKQATPAVFVLSRWPEMFSEDIYGTIVWPCLGDTLGWYKVLASVYVFDDATGEAVGEKDAIAWVKHSPFVGYQTWDHYLKGKYIYGFNDNMVFFSEKGGKNPFSCQQNDCLLVTDMDGFWMQVSTIENSDCTTMGGERCLHKAWIKWVNESGKVLVKLQP